MIVRTILLSMLLALAMTGPARAGVDTSLYLRQCQPFFDRLAALEPRLKSRDPGSPDARAAFELQLTARLAAEYLLGAKNMITVWKAAPAPAEDIDAYLRAQLALYAEKLALDAAGVESVVPAVAEAELATAGHDLLKIVRQLHDFFLAAAKEGGK